MRMNRGGRGFRGAMRGGRPIPPMQGPRQRPYARKGRVTHQVFDEAQVEFFSPRSIPQDDTKLSQGLLKRHQQLTQSPTEQVAVQNLVIKMEHVIENLVLCPEDLEVPIEEVKMVGSFKKGTMLTGHPVADMVIVLKDLPTGDIIDQLSVKIDSKLKERDPDSDWVLKTNEGGFNVSITDAAVIRCLVTTLPRYLLHAVPNQHVDVKLMEGAIATVRHSRWFEENASHTTIKVLVRLLKDMKHRISGLQSLTPWLIDLLAHRATLENVTREPLPLNKAFRRALKLLSSGIFLPGSVGIVDPCESGNLRAHVLLSLEEQDNVCRTAQTLLRCLAHGGCNSILGLETGTENASLALDSNSATWNGVVVVPGDMAYKPEPPPPSVAVAPSDEAKSPEV